LLIGLATADHTLLVVSANDYGTDFHFPKRNDPTLCIQSADATVISQRIYFSHDQTDGYIATGMGGIAFYPENKLLKLCGSTTDFPALKQVGKDFHIRTAADDGYASISCKNLEISGQAWNTIPAQNEVAADAVNIDWSSGNFQTLSLESAAGDVTVTFTNNVAGASYILVVIQKSTGGIDIVWDVGTLVWPDGIVPVVSAGNSAEDVFSFACSATKIYGNCGQTYF
jgi:hypothetical protein